MKAILMALATLLILPMVASAAPSYNVIQDFPTEMVGGGTYTAEYEIVNDLNKEVPMYAIFSVDRESEIELGEFNVEMSIDGTDIDCMESLSYDEWTCPWSEHTGSHSVFMLNDGETYDLKINLRLSLAIEPGSFEYELLLVDDSAEPAPTPVVRRRGSSSTIYWYLEPINETEMPCDEDCRRRLEEQINILLEQIEEGCGAEECPDINVSALMEGYDEVRELLNQTQERNRELEEGLRYWVGLGNAIIFALLAVLGYVIYKDRKKDEKLPEKDRNKKEIGEHDAH